MGAWMEHPPSFICLYLWGNLYLCIDSSMVLEVKSKLIYNRMLLQTTNRPHITAEVCYKLVLNDSFSRSLSDFVVGCYVFRHILINCSVLTSNRQSLTFFFTSLHKKSLSLILLFFKTSLSLNALYISFLIRLQNKKI